ncbi:ferredoxin--NADP reductase [Advenella alkanexedens]|uniref:ferredoxin--NADP reductase n=1 Tax=Advenella alkanexedens TaxID=1481665 RepID=UPI002676EA89|nr:ferredoxin--NADP reductase [Advenella alkanexedens]WKU18905.1 ferredoxin--NADP reductase [Advenella alkanexedens]
MTDQKYTRETVISMTEWVPGKLFSITTTRDHAFQFEPGQFARLGLPASDDHAAEPTIWRAYSMVSTPEDEFLSFYSIVVPEGEFSPRLAGLKTGDPVYIDKTAFGFLTIDRFPQGGNLWLLATGTGLSAYISMLNTPATWERFDKIILAHGVRTCEELTYQDDIAKWQQQFGDRFVYLPLPTREAYKNHPQERLTSLISNGKLEQLSGLRLDPATSRIMLCGNPEMLSEARKILGEKGFAAGRRGIPGNLAVENYW